ncbi:MAG: FAD-binding oxidoreductase [Gemmatimonadota bacterium]|nr:FAD-binding oxidoreductase [Gemmatimonadota bacterium]
MSNTVAERLTRLLGPEGVERDPRGLPRAVPESDDALVLVCQAALDEGWKIRIEGNGTWLPADAPADLALSTRGLTRIISLSPADLVATVQAGVTMEALRAALLPHRLWLAVDPPGRPDRTIGSVVATGTAGPLRHGFGPVRDQILGCTVVTGDGRLVAAGGRVVKNVAGYDLTKLHAGGFGAFGVITDLHLRLRAQPAVDLTLLAQGARLDLLDAGRRAMASAVSTIALELLSPTLAATPDWTLAVRLSGTAEGVAAETTRLGAETGIRWEAATAERAATLWNLVARAPLGGGIVIRLGTPADGLEPLLDILLAHLGEGLLAAGITSGAVRWAGEVDAPRLRALRLLLATREVPLTLERAPWPVRRSIGHFGAYREGVGPLVGRLRDTFDPRQSIAVALEGLGE